MLKPNEIAPSVVNFPRLGVGNFAGDFPNNGKYAASRFVPDEVINPHPRFWTLTQNIRMRRYVPSLLRCTILGACTCCLAAHAWPPGRAMVRRHADKLVSET